MRQTFPSWRPPSRTASPRPLRRTVQAREKGRAPASVERPARRREAAQRAHRSRRRPRRRPRRRRPSGSARAGRPIARNAAALQPARRPPQPFGLPGAPRRRDDDRGRGGGTPRRRRRGGGRAGEAARAGRRGGTARGAALPHPWLGDAPGGCSPCGRGDRRTSAPAQRRRGTLAREATLTWPAAAGAAGAGRGSRRGRSDRRDLHGGGMWLSRLTVFNICSKSTQQMCCENLS